MGVLALSGCGLMGVTEGVVPEPATEQAPLMYNMWRGSWIAAMAVGVLVWGLILWAIVAYRRKSDDAPAPRQIRYNIPLEVLYTVTPLIMVVGLFYFTAKTESEVLKMEDNPAETIQVTGFRWSWAFNYENQDVYDIGTPDKDPTVWVPVNQRVQFDLVSPDVIHSFWVPNFLFKMDVIPGRTNSFQVVPNREGEFLGKCAELCGVDHSRMLFTVKVVSQQEFDAHMADLKARGQVGTLDSGRLSDQAQSVGGRDQS